MPHPSPQAHHPRIPAAIQRQSRYRGVVTSYFRRVLCPRSASGPISGADVAADAVPVGHAIIVCTFPRKAGEVHTVTPTGRRPGSCDADGNGGLAEVRAGARAGGKAGSPPRWPDGEAGALSHSGPFPFPRVTLYDRGRDPLNRLSRPASLAVRTRGSSWAKAPPGRGETAHDDGKSQARSHRR